MKIAIADDSNGSNAHSYIRLGLLRAFAGCGHEAVLWNIQQKSAIDFFDEVEPDLVWLQSYNLERGVLKSVANRPNLRVILTGSDWSLSSNAIDHSKYPIVRANQKEIKLVEQLNDAHKIDFITCHYHQNSMRTTHEYWLDKLGIPIVGLPPAADIVDYTGGKYMEEFACDIMFSGGYWDYKGLTIKPWFFPLLDSSLKLNVKIYGNRPWGCIQYCGYLDNQYMKHAMKSAKVCPNISEPHAQKYGTELNERCFKLLSNKCPVVSDYTSSLVNDIFINGEIEVADTPKEFKEKCLAVVNGDLKIDVEKGYDKVMGSETYFHRVASIFRHLGLEREENNTLQTYSKIRQDNEL